MFRSNVKGAYKFAYDVLNASTVFNAYGRDKEKLAMVLSNPAVLKVFSLQCDLFSMGKVTVKDAKDQPLPDDPFLALINKPNPYTKTESQFLWDFMFWQMLGTAYCYVDSKVVDKKGNKMYFLDPSKIEWPPELETEKDKMIFSDAKFNEIMKTQITYRYTDGTSFQFPYDRMVLSFDLTNSVGNFFKGVSRIDALYKVISNSEHILDSQNVNIRYTSKFLVAGDQQSGNKTVPGLDDDEKANMEEKLDRSEKTVWALRSKTEIKRFVSDLAALQLPQEYLHTYFIIGNMYGIPRDVLEAYVSATYENQEKARGAHVSYCLSPKGNQFMDAYEQHFGYREQGKNICITWDHLPFVQVFAKQKADTQTTQVEVLTSLLKLGVPIEEANAYVGTEFTIEEPEPTEQPAPEAQPGDSGEGQEDAEGEETTDDQSDV